MRPQSGHDALSEGALLGGRTGTNWLDADRRGNGFRDTLKTATHPQCLL